MSPTSTKTDSAIFQIDGKMGFDQKYLTNVLCRLNSFTQSLLYATAAQDLPQAEFYRTGAWRLKNK